MFAQLDSWKLLKCLSLSLKHTQPYRDTDIPIHSHQLSFQELTNCMSAHWYEGPPSRQRSFFSTVNWGNNILKTETLNLGLASPIQGGDVCSLTQVAKVWSQARAKSLQPRPTLFDPVDCSPPGTSVHGMLQARILEWDVMPFSRASTPSLLCLLHWRLVPPGKLLGGTRKLFTPGTWVRRRQ